MATWQVSSADISGLREQITANLEALTIVKPQILIARNLTYQAWVFAAETPSTNQNGQINGTAIPNGTASPPSAAVMNASTKSVPIMRSSVYDNAVDALKGLLEVTLIMVEEKFQREMKNFLEDSEILVVGRHSFVLEAVYDKVVGTNGVAMDGVDGVALGEFDGVAMGEFEGGGE